MNRFFIISLGVFILTIILGVWLYLFLFGAPQDTEEVFTNLGFELNSQATTITPPTASETIDNLIDTTTGTLRQLTTGPIAGYTATTTTTGLIVRYAEKGTSHLYDINLATGAEKVISYTTIPQTATAFFSPNAEKVALTSYQNYRSNTTIGEINDTQNLTISTLEPGAENIFFKDNNTIAYTIANNGTTNGYEQNLATKTRTIVFAFNFVDILVNWVSPDGIMLTTKPSELLPGYAYSIINNTVKPKLFPAPALQTFTDSKTIVATNRTDTGYISRAWQNNTPITLPVVTLREKCVFDIITPNKLWCAAPYSNLPTSVIDGWYKGIYQFTDAFWLIDIVHGNAEPVLNPETELGRTLDVTNLTMSPDGTTLLFINKTDNTLWMLDLTKTN